MVLGARRNQQTPDSASNNDRGIAIVPVDGHRLMTADEYTLMAWSVAADFVVGLEDTLPPEYVGQKRRKRVGERTERWLRYLIEGLRSLPEKPIPTAIKPAVFAPLLSLPCDEQRGYLDLLGGEMKDHVFGLVASTVDAFNHAPAPLAHCCRLSLAEVSNPHQVLQLIALGVDLITAPFIQDVTATGICLNFMFPAPQDLPSSGRLPLGFSMWREVHATDMRPMMIDCECYACRKHVRAYIRHLLQAKEMLAFTLLHIHNLHITEQFFTGVRSSLEKNNFDLDHGGFMLSYDETMPVP